MWQGRVSPVFDVAGRLLVVDVENGAEQARRCVPVNADDFQARAALPAGLGATVLICGAISRPMEQAVASSGVEVIAQTCGDVEHVLTAFARGELGQGAFLMPGCCGRRRLGQRRRDGSCRRAGRKAGPDPAQP